MESWVKKERRRKLNRIHDRLRTLKKRYELLKSQEIILVEEMFSLLEELRYMRGEKVK